MNKKACDKECIGIVKDIKYREHYRLLIVQYEVDGKIYELKENEINKKYEKIKLGFLTIGYKSKPLIEIRTGSPVLLNGEVKVKYCSSNPSLAFLADNDAKISWN